MTLTRLVNRTLQWIGNDALYVRCQVLRRHGEWLNLRHPKTFSEKIHWLKLYYRHPHLRQLVNKHECRDYVQSKIGSAFLPKLLAVYDSVDEIKWDDLPQKFAMKVAHGSGMNVICSNKSDLDFQQAADKLRRWCSADSVSYLHLKEWAYGGGRRCILVEEFLSDAEGNIPNDFKFFCFNGEPKFVQVDAERFSNHQRSFYDLDWKCLPFTLTYPRIKTPVPRPAQLAEMIRVARSLAEGLPFARVDLYAIGSRIVFGEITLYPDGGMRSFEPKEYNEIIGDMMMLPDRRTK